MATCAPGVAAAQREQHSMVCHQRPSRSMITAQTAAPPHRQGWACICRSSGRRCVWQLSALHAQLHLGPRPGAARRWALRWAAGRRCSAQEGRLHETRTATLPRPAASTSTCAPAPVRSARSPWPPSSRSSSHAVSVPNARPVLTAMDGARGRAHRTRAGSPMTGELARFTSPRRRPGPTGRARTAGRAWRAGHRKRPTLCIRETGHGRVRSSSGTRLVCPSQVATSLSMYSTRRMTSA